MPILEENEIPEESPEKRSIKKAQVKYKELKKLQNKLFNFVLGVLFTLAFLGSVGGFFLALIKKPPYFWIAVIFCFASWGILVLILNLVFKKSE